MDELEAFLSGISLVESGSPTGNYGARNPSGAYGRYQIMPENWSGWSTAAGIPGASISDPAAQDRVARFKMTEYYNRYGSWELAAVAWRAGPSVADRIKDNGWGAANSQHVSNDQLQSYVGSVMGQMGVNPRYPTDAVGDPDGPFEFTPGRMMARTLDTMSQMVAGGERMPLQGLNTRVLAVTSPESVTPEMTAQWGGAMPALPLEGTEGGADDEMYYSSGVSSGSIGGTNAERLADPQYQEIAHELVMPMAQYVKDNWGVDVGQYRDLDVRPQGGAALSDHYWGGALDIMTSDLTTGNAIADFFRTNAVALGVRQILWQQENHYDHVHISFLPPDAEGAVTNAGAALLEIQGVGMEPVPQNIIPSTGADRSPIPPDTAGPGRRYE